MATIKDIFDAKKIALDKFIEDYKIDIFIETGTGIGETVEYVAKSKKIVKIYSIEIIEKLAIVASTKMKHDERVQIICDSSINGLKELSQKHTNDRTLFFLDAHFPGADFGIEEYSKYFERKIKTPLEDELDVIMENKNISNDIFIIDDLRIYENGPYDLGNWPKEKGALLTGLDFLNKFIDTHDVIKSTSYSGFAFILPKYFGGLK